jgi:hypothetical protein
MRIIFRGVFLTSENPEAIAKFYEQVAALPIEKIGAEGQYTYWRIDDNGMQLAIHDAKLFAEYTHPARADSNLTHLYFKIDDQGAFLGHLENLGISPFSADDVVITVVDPDGRKVMFGTA